MADSEGTETVQIEDATKSVEKDEPEPMDEEQSIAEVQEEAPKRNENGHQTDEAAPEDENKEEPSKDKESSEQTEETTSEVEKDEEATKEPENENGDQVPEKKESTEAPQQDKPSEDVQQAQSDQPMEAEKSHGTTVAKHYNEHKENTREERKTSPIFYLRNFNNWVKSVLINEFMEKYKRKTYHNLSVLDLGCGKGGDLLKWQKAKISNLVCADIAEVSMKQCEQRYKDLRYSRNHRRYNQSQKIYDAQFITADCSKEDIADKFNSRNKDVKFDMTSCQFALHYAFESAEQAEKMLQNACERLKPGGYFIGTIPSANEIIKRVRQSEDMTFENDCYKITFTEKENISLFGHKYDFHLEGVVDCPEFVVNFPLLEKMAAKYGMTLELAQGFHHFFEDQKDKEQYKFLLNRMNALETYPPKREGDKLASDKEDAYTQAKEAFGEGDDDRTCVGTLSKDEWEATGLYMVFAFKKTEQEPEPTPKDDVKTDVDKMEQSEQQSVEKNGDTKDEEKMEEDNNVEEQDIETKMVQADENDEGDKKDENVDKGEDAEIKGEDSEVKGEDVEIKGEDSEIKGEDSEIKGEDSEIKGEDSEIKGEDDDKKDDDMNKKDGDVDKKDESADKKDESAEKKDESDDKKDESDDKKDESVDKKDDCADKKDESADKKDESADKKGEDANTKDEVNDQAESGEAASTEVFQGNEAGEQEDVEEEKKKPTPQRGRRKRSAGAAKDEAATPEESTEVTPKRGGRKRKSTGGAEEEPPEKKKA